MKSSDLPKHVRDKLKPKPVPGSVWFRLDGDPPTVTHHDKTIGLRTSRGGKRHATMIDTPELQRARNWFIERIKSARHPIAGPIRLRATWFFATADPDRAGKAMQHKPDLDNLEKVLLDILVVRGWIEHDQQVWAHATRKVYCANGVPAGIDLSLETYPEHQPDIRWQFGTEAGAFYQTGAHYVSKLKH